MVATRVKICGITRVEDAVTAATHGADAIGMVFYPPSSRYVSDLGQAREIAQSVGPLVNVVALFVNTERHDIESVLSTVPVNTIQFHGDEDEVFCQGFDRPYMKALRMKPDMNVEKSMGLYPSASGFLLDAYVKGEPGGTGQTFDWGRVPNQSNKAIVLAGGLTPDNVTEAVRATQPYGVDVSGGVERTPGVKDSEKVIAFIKKAKEVVNP